MTNQPKIIGILALQGGFAEHAVMVRKLGYEARLVRSLDDVEGLHAFIIPGGESTVLMNLLKKTKLDAWIKEVAGAGMPIYGTCAGMIVLQQLGLMDIEVDRNAYGSQMDSFEAPVEFESADFPGIFIRAPKIAKVGEDVEVLGKEGFTPVLVRQKNILAGSFHPELTEDRRIHEFFLNQF